MHSQEVLDIFVQLAALGVTPEQAAAGVLALRTVAGFKVGDRVLIARKVETDSAGEGCDWYPSMDGYVGQHGTIVAIDENPVTPIEVECADEDSWWYSPEALDPLPAEVRTAEAA